MLRFAVGGHDVMQAGEQIANLLVVRSKVDQALGGCSVQYAIQLASRALHGAAGRCLCGRCRAICFRRTAGKMGFDDDM